MQPASLRFRERSLEVAGQQGPALRTDGTSVVTFEPSRTREWDEFVAASNDAWLFHLSDWIRIEEAHFRSMSFLIESNDQILGILPLYLDRRRYAGVVPVSVLHTGRGRSGPALATGLGERRRRSVFRAMLEQVDQIARAHHVARLEIRLPSLAPSYLPPLRPQINPLSYVRPFSPVKYGRSLDHPPALDKVVWLEQSEDVLWTRLDDDCRKAVRKANRNGVVAVAAQSRADVEDYHRLHLENCRHTGAGTLPLEHFQALWDAFRDRGLVQIFFAEYLQRRIAALLVLQYRHAATYWGGCSEPAFQHLRPNNLLMWEAIRWTRNNGCRWFELGPTFPFADPTSKMRRIGRFKDQFGGESFYLFEGAMNYRPVKIALLDILDAVAGRYAHGTVGSALRRWRLTR